MINAGVTGSVHSELKHDDLLTCGAKIYYGNCTYMTLLTMSELGSFPKELFKSPTTSCSFKRSLHRLPLLLEHKVQHPTTHAFLSTESAFYPQVTSDEQTGYVPSTTWGRWDVLLSVTLSRVPLSGENFQQLLVCFSVHTKSTSCITMSRLAMSHKRLE